MSNMKGTHQLLLYAVKLSEFYRIKAEMEVPSQVIEELADIQHQIWAHWMKYMFSKCPDQVVFDGASGTHFSTGCKIIPKELVERWTRQIETEYADLSRQEQESDIEQAKKFLHLFS